MKHETFFIEDGAKKAAACLRLLGNEHRLHILCLLVMNEEVSVNVLVERTQLSQSAVSQHLAKLRDEGLVEFRRESQTIYYKIKDPAVKKIIETLRLIYCP